MDGRGDDDSLVQLLPGEKQVAPLYALHNRLSALLWLGQGRTPEQVAELLGVCPRTVCNRLQLYQRGGLEALLTLDYFLGLIDISPFLPACSIKYQK